jgi:hypothetical protein
MRTRVNDRSRSLPRGMSWLAAAMTVTAGMAAIAPRTARADGRIVDFHGAVLAGGIMGGGTASGAPDFYRQTRGPGLGAEVGVRLLVLDLSVRFFQVIGSNGREGTISYIPMLGPSFEIPVMGGGTDIHGRPRPATVVLRPGVAAGFGFGTPGPAHAPLSADQISAKGLLVMGRLGVERFFGPVLGLAAQVEGGYHYFLGGAGLINGSAVSDHSEGWQLGAFGSIILHLGI